MIAQTKLTREEIRNAWLANGAGIDALLIPRDPGPCIGDEDETPEPEPPADTALMDAVWDALHPYANLPSVGGGAHTAQELPTNNDDNTENCPICLGFHILDVTGPNYANDIHDYQTIKCPRCYPDNTPTYSNLPPIGGGSHALDTRATSQKRDNQRAERNAIREAYDAHATANAAEIAMILNDYGLILTEERDVDGTPVTYWRDADDNVSVKQTPYTIKIYNKSANSRAHNAELVNRMEHGWCQRGEATGYAAGIVAALLPLIETPDPYMQALDAMEENTVTDGWIYEDELPESISDEEYAQRFPDSRVIDGVRMFPPVPEKEGARPVQWFVDYLSRDGNTVTRDQLEAILSTNATTTYDDDDTANMREAVRILLDTITDESEVSIDDINKQYDRALAKWNNSQQGPLRRQARKELDEIENKIRRIDPENYRVQWVSLTLTDEPANASTLAVPSHEGGMQPIIAASRYDAAPAISGGSQEADTLTGTTGYAPDFESVNDCARHYRFGEYKNAPIIGSCADCGVESDDTELQEVAFGDHAPRCWSCKATYTAEVNARHGIR